MAASMRSLREGAILLATQATEELQRERREQSRLRAEEDGCRNVQDMLGELPKKIKHDVIVPFTGAAFVKRHLIHTNEVLVSLGCQHYLECSASHAQGILARRREALGERIAACEKRIAELEAIVENWLKECDEDIVDIQEEYDEAQHGKCSATPAVQMGQTGKLASVPEDTEIEAVGMEEDDPEHDRVMAMIEEMERKEAEAVASGSVFDPYNKRQRREFHRSRRMLHSPVQDGAEEALQYVAKLGSGRASSDTPSVSTGEHCQSAAAPLAETQKPAASPQSRPSGLKKGFFNSEKSRTTRKAKGRKAAVAVADAPDNVQGSAFTGKVLERVASTPTTIPPKPVEGAAPGDAMLDAGENVGGTSQAASQPSSQKKPVSRFKQQMMALKAGLPPE